MIYSINVEAFVVTETICRDAVASKNVGITITPPINIPDQENQNPDSVPPIKIPD